jgi:1-deoxy-D-xylulose 5-phosphate reductoisomerase
VEAIKLGKTVALSNKEVLVAAGELVMAAVKQSGQELLPVDSEHNAVHQCLRGGERKAGADRFPTLGQCHPFAAGLMPR